jgi:hypothetical protein
MALPPLSSKDKKILIGVLVGVPLAALVVLLVVFLGVKPGSTPSGVSNLKATRTMDGVTATFTPKNMSEPVVVYAAPSTDECPDTPPTIAQSQVIGPGGTSTYAEIGLGFTSYPTLVQPKVCVWAGAVSPGNAQPTKFTKPVVVPAPVIAYGNNGTAPCALFCAANWGYQMPKSWTGATTVAQQVNPPGGSPGTPQYGSSDFFATPVGGPVGTSVPCLCAESEVPFLTYNQVPLPYWSSLNSGTPPTPNATNTCPQPGLCTNSYK